MTRKWARLCGCGRDAHVAVTHDKKKDTAQRLTIPRLAIMLDEVEDRRHGWVCGSNQLVVRPYDIIDKSLLECDTLLRIPVTHRRRRHLLRALLVALYAEGEASLHARISM